ncbi:MAG: RNA polymerase sigma factor [Butyrivibrio sp.]|nr:RNA polymerase sigma factor [Butyrivibrio sp.]
MDKESTDKIAAAYSRMYSVLYNAAFSRLHDRDIACDLVNDAFVEVLRHRRWWCAQKCSVQDKYLQAACERLCGAYLRKERKHFYISYDEKKESGAAEGGIALAELRQSLDKCMELLDPVERRLIRGKYFENYGTKQLAALIGISEANVLQRLVRARRRLKAIFERCGITEELISSE